ncbi:hypothetical protein CYLTODRAFT_459991 [Cylindrobasidium torrendii FP15055 ss-10]|uniref:Uncharacterized protein n=1 Tax=Cylindrobasidium torrendii FP15055 ss-10 TaxID=1314674 RepID=A0A0D7AVI3_9AGAR|nr:hypothetical protein CYLTODRAFT_459991 [Cylindrobasidium torrendii FP15055 ss-10]
MATQDIEIDEISAPHFQMDSWIERGAQWKDTPAYVADAWYSELVIPADALEYIPDPTDSVKNMLHARIPEIDNGFSLYPIPAYFNCHEKPSSTVTSAQIMGLLRRKIPSSNLLDKLIEAAPQEWLNGKKGFLVDPRLPSARPVPFWALSALRRLVKLSTAHADYVVAQSTISTQCQSPEMQTCFRQFHCTLLQYP